MFVYDLLYICSYNTLTFILFNKNTKKLNKTSLFNECLDLDYKE